MALNLESCTTKELCTLLGGSEKLLIELRDRLQDWLKLQPHLPQDIPQNMLEYFILGTKMSLEQAKRKLDMYYTMRRLVPELLRNRDPRGIRLSQQHKFMQIVVLPKLTPEKHRVIMLRPIADDYSKLNIFDSFKYLMMITEVLMIDNESRSLGNIYVFDHTHVTIGLMAKYTPTVIKKFEVTVTEALARKITGIHNINTQPISMAAISLAKAVLKPKLAARLNVYGKGDYESLYRFIPKSILPKEYGGDEMSMDQLNELWIQKVDKYRDWFLEQENIMVDERHRPGPAVDGDDIFGFSGSFRKLDVD